MIKIFVLFQFSSSPGEAPWLRHFAAAAAEVASSSSSSASNGSSGFRRPPPESDKLYMNVGEGDLIEVGHPAPKPGQEDPRYDHDLR